MHGAERTQQGAGRAKKGGRAEAAFKKFAEKESHANGGGWVGVLV